MVKNDVVLKEGLVFKNTKTNNLYVVKDTTIGSDGTYAYKICIRLDKDEQPVITRIFSREDEVTLRYLGDCFKSVKQCETGVLAMQEAFPSRETFMEAL